MKYNQPFSASDPNAAYINGNPAAGIRGSIPPAATMEFPQREIVKVIVEAGITPSNDDLTQLWQAIKAIAGSIASLTVSNTLESLSFNLSVPYGVAAGANSLVVTAVPAPASYFPGLLIAVKTSALNTLPVTINVNGLGVKTVRNIDGGQIDPGQFPASALILMMYDGTVFQVASVVRRNNMRLFSGFDTAWVSNTQISVDVGIAAAINNPSAVIRFLTPMTKTINTAWSAGSGNGMKSATAFSNGTWHVFVIADSTGVNAPDIFADTSLTPTLPAGYDLYRRVESLIVLSSNIRRYYRSHDQVWWYDPSTRDLDFPNYQPPGDIPPYLQTVSVPLGLNVDGYFSAFCTVADAGVTRLSVGSPLGPVPPRIADSYYFPWKVSAFNGYDANVTDFTVTTDTSARVYFAILTTTVVGWGAALYTLGYADRR